MIKRLLLSLVAMAVPAMANAACQQERFENTPYTICQFDPKQDDLRLFLRDSDGDVLGGFGAVDHMLAENGETLSFAMNAGMYHPDRRAVGLYIEDGTKQANIVTRDGPGNFGLLPNGVFCFGDGQAAVIESRAFDANPPNCRYATQSGPMLVIDGELHPRFLVDGTSRYRRNGVGVAADGRVVFAISDRAVNFHTFGRLFRDHLNVPNALFLDGKVSRIHAPDLGRSELGLSLGPIVGVVVPLDR